MLEHKSYFSRNNFDFVRLIAAAQVMITHGIEFLGVKISPFWNFIYYFPGVPAFFFISGFLISASWERAEYLRLFAINRVLRIFPGLWLVFFFSLATILIFDKSFVPQQHIGGLILWSIGQLTILQDWNPSFFRSYGAGVVNGSLWTIPVELMFYASTPLIYWIGRKLKNIDLALIVIIVLSFAFQYWMMLTKQQQGPFVHQLLEATPIPWIGMFCVGVLAQRHIGRIYPLVAGRFWYFLATYIAFAVLSAYLPYYPLLRGRLNSVGMLNYIAMIGLILATAYSYRGLADRVLRRNDISYGVYIFHMPVVNVLIAIGAVGMAGLGWEIAATILCAALSWTFVERRALALRTRALYRRTADNSGSA